jgi:hypothetical protein
MLIVAFYLTEMARIVFETVSEFAVLYTALFIPVALLLSVLISRFLVVNEKVRETNRISRT